MAGRDRQEVYAKQDQARALRLEGWSFQRIADELGYKNASGAYMAVGSSARRTPVQRIAERIAEEDARLDWLLEQAVAVYRRHHYVVAGKDGDVVCDPATGVPLDDDGPKLAALTIIRQLSESRRKLLGLDAPSRKVVEVVTEDAVDKSYRELLAQMDDGERRAFEEAWEGATTL